MFFFAADGLVAILKKMADPAVAEAEGDGMAGEQPPHESGKLRTPSAQPQMEMVVKQRQGKAVGSRFPQQSRQSRDKRPSVVVVQKDGPTFDPSDGQMWRVPGRSMCAIRGTTGGYQKPADKLTSQQPSWSSVSLKNLHLYGKLL